MRILLVHNAYQQFGGEDAVVSNEQALLEGGGHQVELLLVSNDAIRNGAAAARAALGTIYSHTGKKLVAEAIGKFAPDVVHVHNHFPLLSPSIFDATCTAGVPSVWTLHNFRVTCANGLLFRDGGPCEDCVGRPPLSAVVHRCYRDSLLGSTVVASSIAYHRLRGTWEHKISRFIALNEFSRSKFIAAGIPEERVVVKPNFLPDPGETWRGKRAGFVYVGRLSVEKGTQTLIEAWRDIDAPLIIFGDGPELMDLRASAPPNITFAGHQNRDTVHSAVRRAEALIIPSICYENFPMVLIEAFAAGTPVLAARRGALQNLIEHEVTGLLFEPGDPKSLTMRVHHALAQPNELLRMGHAARAYFLRNLGPENNLRCLETIYREAQADLL